jgi:hypothetical protein
MSRRIIWFSLIAIILAGTFRYFQFPSFWLDEAFVAVSLKEFSLATIFAPLQYGQYFPRLYLLAIGALREGFGYRIGVLRLPGFFCFLVASYFWAKLLIKRSAAVVVVGALAAIMFIGSIFWLEQASQLKQYTFDVLLALIPFLIADDFFEHTITHRQNRAKLLLLVLPCALSYTYPFALFARLLGWYLNGLKRRGPRLPRSSIAWLVVPLGLCLFSIWLTDHQFNMKDRQAYFSYWQDCILHAQFEQGVTNGLRLLAKFFWGWHGRMPLVTAVVAPLQIAGIYAVIKRWLKNAPAESETVWGPRSLGSIILLAGMVIASALLNYPICAGRVTLFAQIHLQLLTLEGAILFWQFYQKRAAVVLWVMVAIISFHTVREYVRFVKAEPSENLLPIVALIKPEISNKAIVQSCSVAQVEALPEPLPVQELLVDFKIAELRGEKVWVVWSHLGTDYCVKELAEIRAQAKTWQILADGNGRGLALAEF